MNRYLLLFVLTMFHQPSSLGADVPPTLILETLSPTVASSIVATAVDECSKRGYKVAAAVVGRDGNLLAFLRHGLSGPHTVMVSQRKAYSSATFQATTAAMQSRTDLNFAPDILLIVGGIPIHVGGKFYGGIAVAGAEPEVDEACAKAGLDAVIDTLEFAE